MSTYKVSPFVTQHTQIFLSRLVNPSLKYLPTHTTQALHRALCFDIDLHLSVHQTQLILNFFVPKINVLVSKFTFWVKFTDELHKLCNIRELLDNVFRVGMANTFGPMFTVTEDGQQFFHFFEKIGTDSRLGLKINIDRVTTITATHHGRVLFCSTDLKVVIWNSMTFCQIPFTYSSQYPFGIIEIHSKFDVSMWNAIVPLVTEN